MIILDFSQVMLANLSVQLGIHSGSVEPDLLKHMVLNTLRSIRTKFSEKQYGELIIACDGRSWRRNIYPYYKANRDKSRSKSELNWSAIFEVFNKIREDVKNFFPYRVVSAEGAEADDVIGTLVEEFGFEGLAVGEQVIIMSGDKDFAQLHRYGNVKQYDPVKKDWITHSDPDRYLIEHIIKGDVGDGVPNILSDDDTLIVPGKRQKPMTAKRMQECKEMFYYGDKSSMATPEITAKFLRNQQLIDLRNTPDEIHQAVMASYEAQGGKTKRHIFNYLMKNRMRGLMENIQDF